MKKQQNVQKPLKRLLSLLLVVVLLAGQMGGALSALAWVDVDDDSGESEPSIVSEEGEGDGEGTGDGENDTSSTVTFELSDSSEHVTLGTTSVIAVDGYYTVTLTADTYYALPGSVTVGDVTVNEGENDGYSWDSTTGTLKISTSNVTASSTVTITALAGEITCTITLHADGGTIDDNDWTYDRTKDTYTLVVKASDNVPTVTLPTVVTKNDYNFGGWYTSNLYDTDGQKADTYVTVGNDVIEEYNFYAKWTKAITFDANGGEFADYDTTSVEITGTDSDVPPSVSRTGYTISGWNTEKDGTGTTVANGTSFQNLTNGATYYAQWVEVEMTIDVKESSADEAISSVSGEKDDSSNYIITATLDNAEYADTSKYKLTWSVYADDTKLTESADYTVSLDSTNGTATITVNSGVFNTTDVMLYVAATATAKNYNVDFKGSGYTVAPEETNSATYGTDLSVTIAASDNYTLTGDVTVKVDETTLTSGVTWTRNYYNGTYSLTIDGSAITGDVTVEVGTTFDADQNYAVNQATVTSSGNNYTVATSGGYTYSQNQITNSYVLIAPSGVATTITSVTVSDNTVSGTYAGIIVGTVDNVDDGGTITDSSENVYYVLGDFSGSITFTLSDGTVSGDASVTTSVNVDTTKPVVTIVPDADSVYTADDKTVYANGQVEYTLTVTEENFRTQNGYTLTVKLNGNNVDQNGYNLSNWTESEDGVYTATLTIYNGNDTSTGQVYTIDLSVTDRAGNTGTADTASLTVDKTAPEAGEAFTVTTTGDSGVATTMTLTPESGSYTVNGDFTYTVTLTDTASGVKTTDATITAVLVDSTGSEVSGVTLSPTLNANDDGTATLAISISPRDVNLENGTYQIKITGITDNAGNELANDTNETAYYSTSFVYKKGILNAAVTVKAASGNTNTYTDESGNLYYNGDVTVTLKVESSENVAWTSTEAEDGNTYYTSTDVILTINGDEVDWSNNDYSLTGFTKDEDTDLYTATFTLSAPAAEAESPVYQYTIDLKVTDDNSTSDSKEDTEVVIFDTKAPTEKITSNGTATVDTSDWADTWAQSHTVVVEFTDQTTYDSGIASTTYYIEASSSDYNVNNITVNNGAAATEESKADYESGTSLEIKVADGATFEGTLYITATDNVGNTNIVKIPLALDADDPDVTVGTPYYTNEDSSTTDLTASSGTYYANAGVTYPLTVEDNELASVTVTVTESSETEEGGESTTSYTLTYAYDATTSKWIASDENDTLPTTVKLTEGTTSSSEWNATLAIAAGTTGTTTTYTVAVEATDTAENSLTPEEKDEATSTLVMDNTDPTAEDPAVDKDRKVLKYALEAGDETLLDRVVITVTRKTLTGYDTYTLTSTYTNGGWSTPESQDIKILGSTIATIELKVDDSSDEDTWAGTLTITAKKEIDSDPYDVTIVTFDKAGNSSEKTAEEVILDTELPTVEVGKPYYADSTDDTPTETDDTYYANQAVSYDLTADDTNLKKVVVTVKENGEKITYTYDETEGKWTTDDNISGVTITLGEDCTAASWAATLTIAASADTASDSYVVSVTATDKDNPTDDDWSTATSAALIIDTVDPVPTITGPNDYSGEKYYSNTEVTYDLKVVDENLEEELITVQVNNEDVSALADVTLGTWEKDGNTWTNTVTITASKNVASTDYTVTLTATDYAGNEPTEPTTSDTVVIDTVDPVATVGAPSGTDGYEDSVYYAGAGSEVTYSLTATDTNLYSETIIVTDGNDNNLFYYDTLIGGNTTRGNISLTIDTDTDTTWKATLTITAQDGVDTSDYQVYLWAQDKAHNDDYDTSKILVIDTVAPTVTYTNYSGNVYASDYYANTTGKVSGTGDSTYYVFEASATTDLHVTVTVTDANIDMTGKEITVTRYSSLANAKSQIGGSVAYVPSDWSSNADGTVWTQTVTIPANAQEGYYVLTLTATDKAANAYDTNSVGANTGATANVLVNDTTAPTVTASVANPTNIGSYGGKNVYYVTASGNLAVTFSISDNNDLLTNANGDNSSYSFTLFKYTSANNASVVTVPASASNFTGWSGSATSKTGTYTLDRSALGLSDGIYAVELTVTDQAGNSTTYRSDYLVIDTTAPEGTIQAGGSGFSGFWKELLSTITFGLYSNDGISYTLTWHDNSDSFLNSSEGVKSVQYAIYDLASGSQAYTTTSALAAAKDVSWQSVSNVSADSTSASVGNDDKFVIYLRIEDMAGNVTYISSDGLITENDPSQINSDTTDPEILVTVANENGNTSGVHDSSVSLGVEIVEYPNITFSGIDQSTIAYTISDGYDGSVSLSTTDGSGMTFSTNSDGLKGSGNQTVVVSVPEGYESDQIYLTATVTDNAGNAKTVEYTALNVDNRTPTATVTYDNNTAYNSYYFNSARVATIVIQEMNFDASNTQVTTEGSLSGWTTTGTGSETTNTATVTYNQDGDYTIAIQSTDLAGHTMTDGDVVYEGVATQSFTIDMTAPTVSVTFTDASGNTVPSGGYANSTVTATITVVEHNFDASSATSGIHITRDGETYTPSISWSNNGDVHTAVITFTEEEGAYYTFDISFIDLANNQSAAFSTQSFYVDTMAPSVVVDNISNNSANNAAVIAPVITITDKYYDEANVTVTLTGAKTGVVANAYTVTDTENGQIFTFNNIEADDIYTITVTVTDLAGNVIETMYVTDSEESTDNLTFSVNRNGSTYQVDEDTAALLESYYVSSIDDDVVIEIINVDPIEDIVITVTRGLLRSWDLTEGEDYSIVEEEITGGYRYTITIFKEVFDEDGAYSISIYTEDAAGNTSTNNTANDDQAIQLDFYLDSEGPIIVLNDLVKNGRYNYSAYDEASVSVTDATLEEITVDIIYQDGTGTKTYTWGEEEIYAEDFTGTFIATLDEEKAIAESTSQIRIEISARDKAGNVAYGPVDEETNEVDGNYYFTVSTNPFVRFFANKPLFYGTIAALILIILLIILLIVLRRKKSEEEETGETVQEDTKGKEKAEEK